MIKNIKIAFFSSLLMTLVSSNSNLVFAEGTESCKNECPCQPSDKPNECDIPERGWCMKPEKITKEMAELRVSESRQYVKIAIEYLLPDCGVQPNIRPYDSNGVELYITAKTKSEVGQLGSYNASNPLLSELSLDEILAGPVKLQFLPDESNADVRFFETPNEGIPLTDIKIPGAEKEMYIDIVLRLTGDLNRPTARAEFPLKIEPKDSYFLTLRNEAVIIRWNNHPIDNKPFWTLKPDGTPDKLLVLYSYNGDLRWTPNVPDVPVHSPWYVLGQFVKEQYSLNPPPEADPPPHPDSGQHLPNRGWMKPGDVIWIGTLADFHISRDQYRARRFVFKKEGVEIQDEAELIQLNISELDRNLIFQMPAYDLEVDVEYIPIIKVRVNNGMLYSYISVGDPDKPVRHPLSFSQGYSYLFPSGDCQDDIIVPVAEKRWGPTCAKILQGQYFTVYEDLPPDQGVLGWEILGEERTLIPAGEIWNEVKEKYPLRPSPPLSWGSPENDGFKYVGNTGGVTLDLTSTNLDHDIVINVLPSPKNSLTLQNAVFSDNNLRVDLGWRHGYKGDVFAGKNLGHFYPWRTNKYLMQGNAEVYNHCVAWLYEPPFGEFAGCPIQVNYHLGERPAGIGKYDLKVTFVNGTDIGGLCTDFDHDIPDCNYRWNNGYCWPVLQCDSVSPASLIDLEPESQAAIDFSLTQGLEAVGPSFHFKGWGETSVVFPSAQAVRRQQTSSPVCLPVSFSFSAVEGTYEYDASKFVFKFPALTAGSGKPALYMTQDQSSWDQIGAQSLDGEDLKACLSVAGSYQVFAESAGAVFQFGEVYVFPNPVTKGYEPVLHVEAIQAGKIGVRIYDVSGSLVLSETNLGFPQKVDGKSVYQKTLGGTLKPGVYYGVVSAHKTGKPRIEKKFRFSILK